MVGCTSSTFWPAVVSLWILIQTYDGSFWPQTFFDEMHKYSINDTAHKVLCLKVADNQGVTKGGYLVAWFNGVNPGAVAIPSLGASLLNLSLAGCLWWGLFWWWWYTGADRQTDRAPIEVTNVGGVIPQEKTSKNWGGVIKSVPPYQIWDRFPVRLGSVRCIYSPITLDN